TAKPTSMPFSRGYSGEPNGFRTPVREGGNPGLPMKAAAGRFSPLKALDSRLRGNDGSAHLL
ncbi:hypothetical protein, partial [Ramlibacter alkalitolerans]